MRPPRVTIRSVASEAGVSVTTVSNVLNGRDEQMGADTRERVLAAMKRLGYHPNRLAQGLVTRRTATIGLNEPIALGGVEPLHSSGLQRTSPLREETTSGNRARREVEDRVPASAVEP